MMMFHWNDDTRVFFRIGNILVGYAVLLALLLAVSMLMCAVIGPFRYSNWLAFSTSDSLARSWWRVFVQTLFIAPAVGSILQLVFIGFFGHQLENAMRSRDFLVLMLSLCFAPPILAAAMSPIFSSLGMNAGNPLWAGTYMLGFGLFLAMICQYPNRPSFFSIPIKWFGVIFLLADVLQNIAMRDWVRLATHGLTWFGVWQWMKRQGYALSWGVVEDIGIEMPIRNLSFGRKNPLRESTPKIKPRTIVDTSKSSVVDKILDKVSSEGIHSLTEKERRILNDASNELRD